MSRRAVSGISARLKAGSTDLTSLTVESVIAEGFLYTLPLPQVRPVTCLRRWSLFAQCFLLGLSTLSYQKDGLSSPVAFVVPIPKPVDASLLAEQAEGCDRQRDSRSGALLLNERS
jgi:hypothetical protein